MKIALLGTRGVPASYSGFETCVEQLGKRLVERGHEVVVYCRKHHLTYLGDSYLGMRLIKLPTITNKYLDTIVHSLLSSLHALPKRYDVALYFIAGNSPVSWIPRIVGTKTLLNVDGLDWKREKWPWAAKKYIQFAEYLATILPNSFLTDSYAVQNYYENTYNRQPSYIPYGSEVEVVPPGQILAKYGLEARKYVLFVGRLVPENCAHHLVSAFKKLETDFKCVIVGDAPYANDYQAELKALASGDQRILFTGYVFGNGYHELGSNAYIFVETSGVGGTHPALLEAMAFGNCVVTHNTLENLETIGDSGLTYNGEFGSNGLAEVLERLLKNHDEVEKYRQKASQRAKNVYSWEMVTDKYEILFHQITKKALPENLKRIIHS